MTTKEQAIEVCENHIALMEIASLSEMYGCTCDSSARQAQRVLAYISAGGEYCGGKLSAEDARTSARRVWRDKIPACVAEAIELEAAS